MKVLDYYGLIPKDGEVGIEIELEGKNVELATCPGWRRERDGSLRGESVEFVMEEPVPLLKVHQYVRELQASLEEVRGQPVDTGRAGVHVHLNMQQYTLTQVINTICAYIIFEELLTDFCGDHRVGNLFCLRVQDADRLLFALRDRIDRKDLLGLDNNDNRYAAINIEALPKFGSLEFRAMRSTVDPDEITRWAGMLTSIRDWAVQFKDPRDIIVEFSQMGPRKVFDEVFQQYNDDLIFDSETLYRGVRNAQFVAFSTDDWDFDPKTLLRKVFDAGLEGFEDSGYVARLLVCEADIYSDIQFALHLYRCAVNFQNRKKAVRDIDEDFDEDEDLDEEDQ